MACISDENVIEVFVPSFEINQDDKITHYTILIKIGSISWTVSHRYSLFVELHESLVINHGLAKDLLPPKKLIGNKNPAFIEKRRTDLQIYLQNVVNFMKVAMPDELVEFLNLKEYEIKFLLQSMARNFFKEGEQLIQNDTFLLLNPLQLMAITQQLKMPHSLFLCDLESDFTNIVDVCSSLLHLKIEGSNEEYKSSNIILNELCYSLSEFKNVKKLNILKADVSKIDKLGIIRTTVQKVSVNECGLSKINDIILCDLVHKNFDENLNYTWTNLVALNLSLNNINEIDKSVILIPNLQNLNLDSNELVDVGSYLTKLPNLVSLSLSNNKIVEVLNLHTKLGNIKLLNLSHNNISDLGGLSKLYSIVTLNVAFNNIQEVSKVDSICNLPCLEELIFTGNPVATVVDYRTKVLELFGKRACEISLDNETPSQKELDKVAVLQALRLAREGRLPTISLSHPMPTSPAALFLETPDVASIAKES